MWKLHGQYYERNNGTNNQLRLQKERFSLAGRMYLLIMSVIYNYYAYK